MNQPGGTDLLVAARSALLDALEALKEHINAVIVVGAQAVYLHTGAAPVALAEATKDCDLALDTRELAPEPLLEDAMRAARLYLDLRPTNQLPAQAAGIPVDLIRSPEAIGDAETVTPRGAHSATRERRGELLGWRRRSSTTLPSKCMHLPSTTLVYTKLTLLAQLHCLSPNCTSSGNMQDDPRGLVDKDAHDVYRLLVAVPTDRLASKLVMLRNDDLAGSVTNQALTYFAVLFAAGADAPGAQWRDGPRKELATQKSWRQQLRHWRTIS